MEEEKKVEETTEKNDYIIDPVQHELDELNDRYKRVLAEFENFKKRSGKLQRNHRIWEKLHQNTDQGVPDHIYRKESGNCLLYQCGYENIGRIRKHLLFLERSFCADKTIKVFTWVCENKNRWVFPGASVKSL